MSATRLESRNAWWFSLSLTMVVIDQLTKYLVIENLSLYQRIPLMPMLAFQRLHNTGAAFSFLADASGWQNWLFSGVAVAVSVVIIWWVMTLPYRQRLVLTIGLALVLGGAIGNLIDRVLYGYVVDFILVHYHEWSYPAFNVADSAITVGVALILFDGIVLDRRREREAGS